MPDAGDYAEVGGPFLFAIVFLAGVGIVLYLDFWGSVLFFGALALMVIAFVVLSIILGWIIHKVFPYW